MKVNEQLNEVVLANIDSAQQLFDLVHHMSVTLSKLLVICEKYAPAGIDRAYLQVLKGIEETVEYHLANKTHVH